MGSRNRAGRSLRLLGVLGPALAMPSSACNRSSLVDIPLWRVEADSSGREVRMVQLPFEQTSYDLVTHAVVRKVMDRNQDGISDRIVTYQGLGGARSEETDTDFDGIVDRWDTFAADGRRIRSATAGTGSGARSDRHLRLGGKASPGRNRLQFRRTDRPRPDLRRGPPRGEPDRQRRQRAHGSDPGFQKGLPQR